MFVVKGRIDTYTAEAAIVDAQDIDMNAVKIVEKGTAEDTVKEATAGANKYAIQGAIATIGPPTQPVLGMPSTIDVAIGDTLGIMADGIIGLIRAKGSGNAVGNRQVLQSVGNGKVGPLALSGTPTNEEKGLIIAESCDVLAENTAADDRVEAELLLER